MCIYIYIYICVCICIYDICIHIYSDFMKTIQCTHQEVKKPCLENNSI